MVMGRGLWVMSKTQKTHDSGHMTQDGSYGKITRFIFQ